MDSRYEAHIAPAAQDTSQEQQIRGSTAPLPWKTLLDVSRAVCKVEVDGATGTGFLAKFQTATDMQVHGLFTSNHVLSEAWLRCIGNSSITLHFDEVHNIPVDASAAAGSVSSFSTAVPANGFRFTCPILDATFIHFIDADVRHLKSRGCGFLEVSTGCEETKDVPVFTFQHPRGADIHFAPGVFLQYYGLDMFHTVSTDYGSSGSPVIRSDGRVIGLHKARSAVAKNNYNVAVTMKAVVEAVRPYFRSFKDIPRRLVCNLEILDPTYESKLRQIGLEKCPSATSSFQGTLYISPLTTVSGFLFTTSIWFAPTSHGWYWTPTDPSSRTKETNWMPVCQKKVVGGYWNGLEPAPRNVRIIQWLFHHNIHCGVCPA